MAVLFSGLERRCDISIATTYYLIIRLSIAPCPSELFTAPRQSPDPHHHRFSPSTLKAHQYQPLTKMIHSISFLAAAATLLGSLQAVNAEGCYVRPASTDLLAPPQNTKLTLPRLSQSDGGAWGVLGSENPNFQFGHLHRGTTSLPALVICRAY